MKRLFYLLPVLGFGVLAFFLFRSLSAPDPSILPSALIDKPAPRLVLPALDAATSGFGPAQLADGHVSVVNVFASWCAPCHDEAPVLAQLAALAPSRGFALYGLVQKDTPQKVRAFLDKGGNPFSRIALDADGRASIEWGVYGVPETFVVDGKGIIRLRYVGALTPAIVADRILPAIADSDVR
ncbi:MAG TPA: DsbE family thiol:disulfide interchange protein [Rhizomicrobium sp.]